MCFVLRRIFSHIDHVCGKFFDHKVTSNNTVFNFRIDGLVHFRAGVAYNLVYIRAVELLRRGKFSLILKD